jgi:cytochrome c553
MKALILACFVLALSILPLRAQAPDFDPAMLGAVDGCAACHGADGVSIADGFPNLAGQKAVYLRNQLRAFKAGTRQNAIMNAIAGELSDEEIDALAAFYASLPGAPSGAERSEMLPQLVRDEFPFPDDYQEAFVKYHTISFPAPRNQVRHYWANEAAVAAAREGRDLPDGSYLLIEIYSVVMGDDGEPVRGEDGHFVEGDLVGWNVMAREPGWGDAVPELLRNEDWNYAAFRADRTVNTGANQAACLACHVPLTDTSYVFTLDELTAVAQ